MYLKTAAIASLLDIKVSRFVFAILAFLALVIEFVRLETNEHWSESNVKVMNQYHQSSLHQPQQLFMVYVH